jgi:hypothetical protein
MGRIQEMTPFSKREALYHKIQQSKKRGIETSKLEGELRFLDHQLDQLDEPLIPSLSNEEFLLKKLDVLFEKCAALAKMKSFSLMYLIKGHPKAELARLIPKICHMGEKLESPMQKEIVCELRLESEKAWNRELYSTGFLKIYQRWCSNKTKRGFPHPDQELVHHHL